jgi:hypothetical protein
MMIITDEMLAYAIGYWDGRHEGVEENVYRHADPCRAYYTTGYETGVGDYCRYDSENREIES